MSSTPPASIEPVGREEETGAEEKPGINSGNPVPTK
jgi:hypothetical protein